MFKICVGGLGWTPEVFWRSSVFDATLAAQGYNERIQEEYRTDWETARFSGYCAVVAMHGKSKIESVKNFWPLPWDVVHGKGRKLTKKQIESGKRIAEKWRDIPVGTGLKPIDSRKLRERHG